MNAFMKWVLFFILYLGLYSLQSYSQCTTFCNSVPAIQIPVEGIE
jgi:hypothetical protein